MKRTTKTVLIDLVAKRLDHSIHKMHISSVVNIFIDEMKHDIKSGNNIKIDNFGIFKVKKLKSKRINNIHLHKLQYTKQTYSITLSLSNNITQYLRKKVQ
jgi:nucleoid DNA-binding protein